MIQRLCAVLLLAVLGAAPAKADYVFEPGFDGVAPLGPAKAKGALIWNHGLARLGEPSTVMPAYMAGLKDSGWDVYRLVRKWSGDREYDSSQALIAEARKLKAQGYARVVSAGQSFGGWISFLAARENPPPFDAMIATAPAAHGEFGQSSRWRDNGPMLFSLVRDMQPIPALVFFFAKDNFDPGGRGEELQSIFAKKNQPYGLVDQPSGFSGHGPASGPAFAKAFGACLTGFLDQAPLLQGRYACNAEAVKTSLDAFSLPKDLKPPHAGGGFLGRWLGAMENGREAFLQIDAIENGEVSGVYGWGALAGDKAGYRKLTGKVEGERLRLANDRIQIELKLSSETQGELRWMRPDGTSVIPGTVERVN